MTTHGAWGFRFRGHDKVGYCDSDSYPKGLGATVLDAVVRFDDDELAGAADRLLLVERFDRPPPELIERYRPFASDDEPDEWEFLLIRSWSEGIAPYVDGRIEHLPDAHEELADSLYCQWAYIINLDEHVVECHTGFNREPGGPGRYAEIGPNDRGYYGVRLRAAVSLDAVREQGIRKFIDEWGPVLTGTRTAVRRQLPETCRAPKAVRRRSVPDWR